MQRLLAILSSFSDEIDFMSGKSLLDSGELTSFDLIRLIKLLEAEYDVSIPMAEINASSFNSAQGIFDMLSRVGAAL